MQSLKTIDASIISLIILALIYLNAFNRSEKGFLSYKLFIHLIQINLLLIVIDILGWTFNGLPGQVNYYCNIFFNLLLYMFAPAAASIWILYIHNQIFQDERKYRFLTRILFLLLSINAAISLLSIKFGLFFHVNSDNIYSRGPFFWIHVFYCYCLLMYAFMVVLLNRNIIEKRYFGSLLFFFLPQLIGTTLQMFMYGVSFNWVGSTISILIMYFNIQNRGLNLDYLTGAFNRRKLDEYIKSKIRSSSSEKSFSAILIDMNHFKEINDSFGHHVGDEALKDVVRLLQECLHNDTFISRFGGDEFVIILDINTQEELEKTVRKIEQAVEHFNQEAKTLYRLSFSIGYDIYDWNSHMSADEYLKKIDMHMYSQKKVLNLS